MGRQTKTSNQTSGMQLYGQLDKLKSKKKWVHEWMDRDGQRDRQIDYIGSISVVKQIHGWTDTQILSLETPVNSLF